MTKTALITGITGQDGPYLADFLLDKNYEIYGTYRRTSSPNFWRLQSLGILDQINLVPVDLADASSLTEAVRVSEPDEVYHLAAQSFVGASFEAPLSTGDVTGLATCRLLEAIRHNAPGCRFYQASTSELYGNAGEAPQNEETEFNPVSPYAAAKLYAHNITQTYRGGYDIFACAGILFNHESPLRGLEFVTRKISNAVARIKLGLQEKVYLGNLDAKRDWGYAPEYVEAMWRMLQQDAPDDYVIATGEAHSVRDFCEAAFGHVDLDWEACVEVDQRFFRPIDVNVLRGDPSKAERELGWERGTSFHHLVETMVDADLERWRRWEKGEKFPWDAPDHPDEMNIITRSPEV